MNSAGRVVGRAGAWAVLAAGAALFVLPLAVIVAGAPDWPGLGEGPATAGLVGRIGSGLALIGAVIVLDLVVLLPVALVVALRAPHLRTAVATLTLVPWLAPPIVLVAGVALAPAQVADWFGSGTLGLVPVYALWTVPFTYRVLDAGLHRADSRAGYEAALVAGCPVPTALTRVVLPGIRRPVVAAALLTGATVLGEYAFAAMLLRPTLITAAVDTRSFDPNGSAMVLLAVLLLVTAAGIVLAAPSRRSRPA